MNRAVKLSSAVLGALLAPLAGAQAPAAQAPAATPPAATPPGHSSMMMGASPMRAAPAAGAEVYIISPRNGAKVHGPVTVRFGLKGMGVAPSSCVIENTGHHHLLIDTDLKDVNLDQPLPATDKVVHFGKGQTETTLTLAPGKHTLELLFADSKHMSFDPPLNSQKISITVE